MSLMQSFKNIFVTVGSNAEAMSSSSSTRHYVWAMAASYALPTSAEGNLKVHGAD